jgi:hypothetical protein
MHADEWVTDRQTGVPRPQSEAPPCSRGGEAMRRRHGPPQAAHGADGLQAAEAAREAEAANAALLGRLCELESAAASQQAELAGGRSRLLAAEEALLVAQRQSEAAQAAHRAEAEDLLSRLGAAEDGKARAEAAIDALQRQVACSPICLSAPTDTDHHEHLDRSAPYRHRSS